MIVYRELSSLVSDLGIDAKTLYAVSDRIDRHYRTVQIPRPQGGSRTLSVPDPLLKQIGRRILGTLLVHMPVSQYATAYRYGGSTLHNALPHVGQPMLLKLDIRRFFDSILYAQVRDAAFPAQIYAEGLRTLLTTLCYHREGLPQGAPTSPAITNILMAGFDEAVGAWCRARAVAYTRYCDDMTFSGSFDPHEVIAMVEPRLRAMGFFLNHKKTRILPAGQRQIVTGIVVNEKPALPAEALRALRQEVHFCKKFGVAGHMQHCGIAGTQQHYLQQLLPLQQR